MRDRLLSAVKACFTGTRTRCNSGEHLYGTPANFSRLRLPRSRRQPGRAPGGRTRRAPRVRADPLGRHTGRQRRLRGQRLLARHQARRRQGGLAPQRRLLQLAERRHPDVAQRNDARERRAAAQRHAQHGRPAPHPAAQDHLPRLHPPGDRPPGGRARRARPEHRQERGRRGHRRLRRTGVVRAAAAGHRRPAGRAAGGPRQAVPLVQRDDRRRGPRIRRRRSRAVVDGTDHVRDGDGRRAGQEPDRRHRHDADPGRHRRGEALRRRVRLLRHHAGGGRQRDHPQLDHPRHDRVREQPGSVGAVQEGASVDHGRRDHPLGHPGIGVPAHRQRGHRIGRRADQEGPAGGDVLPVGQLRRRGLRGSALVQHPARPEPARRDSAAPVRTTASAPTWPG